MPLQLKDLPVDLDPAIREWAETLRSIATTAPVLSAADLAARLNYAPSTVSRYLSGQRVVDADAFAVKMLGLLAEPDRRRWPAHRIDLQYRRALAARSDPDSAAAAPPAHPPVTVRRKPRRRRWPVAAGALGAAAAVSALLWDGHEPSPSTTSTASALDRVAYAEFNRSTGEFVLVDSKGDSMSAVLQLTIDGVAFPDTYNIRGEGHRKTFAAPLPPGQHLRATFRYRVCVGPWSERKTKAPQQCGPWTVDEP